MDIQNLVQVIQKRSGCNYYSAITQVEAFLELKYGIKREIKDAISKLRNDADKKNNNCPNCKIEMEIFDVCTLCCFKCGRLAGRNIDDINSDSEINCSERKTVFDNEKHFLEWIMHILGRESIIAKRNSAEFTKHVETIRNYIQQNNIQLLTPEDLRKILKKINLSKYYKHTSYYFKMLTNVGPPNIPEEYIYRAKYLFRDFVKAKKQIQNLRPNNPSYPFLVYKIFDIVLPLNDLESRRIFYFIHLPGKKALENRNKEWEIIWQQICRSNSQ